MILFGVNNNRSLDGQFPIGVRGPVLRSLFVHPGAGGQALRGGEDLPEKLHKLRLHHDPGDVPAVAVRGRALDAGGPAAAGAHLPDEQHPEAVPLPRAER